jgi:hypothetical protein
VVSFEGIEKLYVVFRLWVVHTVPRLLKMSGFDILTEFHKMGTLRGKGFEIVRRLLNYVMSSYYSDDDVSRFGHCMPTKWMVSWSDISF